MLVAFLIGYVLGLCTAVAGGFVMFQKFMKLQEVKQMKPNVYKVPRHPKGTRDFIQSQASNDGASVETNPAAQASASGSNDRGEEDKDTLPPESMEAINLATSFLFMHLRDTIKVKSHIHKILDRNLKILRQKTTLGALCRRMRVIQLDLGSEMLRINSCRIVKPKDGTLGKSDLVEYECDISYAGKGNVVISADMMFRSSATISITLVEIAGTIRFAFRTEPHLHWTVAFVQDKEPTLDLQVETLLNGRSLPRLASIVANQIRSTVRRIHTLPNLKKRHDPFFPRPIPKEEKLALKQLRVNARDVHQGRLTVEVLDCDAVEGVISSQRSFMFVALSLSAVDPYSMQHVSDELFEVTIPKLGAGGKIGIGLEDKAPKLKTIREKSPAADMGLVIGDVIKKVNDKPVLHSKQALKLIAESPDQAVKLQLHRPNESKNGTGQKSLMGERIGKYCETRCIPAVSNPVFHETHSFEISPSTTSLYITLYDAKKATHEEGTSTFVLGCAQVQLDVVGLYCIVNQSPMLKRVKLHKSFLEGAPFVGYINLVLKHTPLSRLPSQTASTMTSSDKTFSEFAPAISDIVPPTPLVPGSFVGEEDETIELMRDVLPTERLQKLKDLLTTVENMLELEEETKQSLIKSRAPPQEETAEQHQRFIDNVKASKERKDKLQRRALRVATAIINTQIEMATELDAVAAAAPANP
eukprot:m.181867 g.181867  ORF g.181867 m.181867 type:complete len:699 (-) comp14665_c0_seq1:423-2519(-)